MSTRIDSTTQAVTLSREQVAILRGYIDSLHNWSIRPMVDADPHRERMDAYHDYCMQLLEGGNDE